MNDHDREVGSPEWMERHQIASFERRDDEDGATFWLHGIDDIHVSYYTGWDRTPELARHPEAQIGERKMLDVLTRFLAAEREP